MLPLAVFCCFVLRAALAGYGGPWFFPAIALSALRDSVPFVAVALVGVLLARAGGDDRDRHRAAVHIAGYVVLFGWLGNGWVAPHESLARIIGSSGTVNVAMLAFGLAFGSIAEVLTRERPAAATTLVWTVAAWLIIGPWLYRAYDHVEAGRRLTAALAIGGALAVAGLLLAAIGERLGALRWNAALALVAAGVVAVVAISPGATGKKDSPSVVLVVVDTLRADELDAVQADGRPLMPRLSAIAGEGVRFTQAIAPAPWTLPSTLSILSGMNPHRHHAGRMDGVLALRGDPRASYLGPLLRSGGYLTAAFVNNPWLRPYYGFGRGFLTYRRYHTDAARGVDLTLSWLSSHAIGMPSFVWLHLMDPHWPYQAPNDRGKARQDCPACDSLPILQYQPTTTDVRAEVRRRYRAEVAYVDEQIGRLYDGLERRGRLDDTWFVVVADHGEEFWEHQRFLHGHSFYDELLRVPLVVVPPRRSRAVSRGRTVDSQVRLEDVVPTLLEAMGLPVPASSPQAGRKASAHPGRESAAGSASSVESPSRIDGVSLLDLIRGDGRPHREPPAVAGFIQADGDGSYAVRTTRWKLLMWPGHRFPVLFDLLGDPGETANLASDRPGVVAELARVPAELGLDVRLLRAPGTGAHRKADADLMHELRSLGYVD